MNVKKPEIFINLGGVFPFFLIPISEITEMEDLILGEINFIDFANPEFTPYYISTIQEQSKLVESQKAIDKYEYELTAVISKSNLYYRNILEALNTEKHICIVPDANNSFRLLGNIDNGAILSADTSTGSNVADLNYISITVNWESNYRAAFTNLYKTYIMQCDTDIAIQPYISTIDDISVVEHTSGTFQIDGDNFDENMTISLGPNIVVNSYEAFGDHIIINYTAGDIQAAFPISIKRGDYEHYGENPQIAVNEVLLGTGPAGDFITSMEAQIVPNEPYGPNWTLNVYGDINSIDDFYKLLANNQGTPSNSTGPDQGNGSGYSYIETSNPNNGTGQFGRAKTSYFRQITNISFDYHRYGSGLGDFIIHAKNRNNNWVEVFRLSGQQQTSSSEPWLTANIDMRNIEAKSIRFTNKAASSYMGDMAIDNIVITSI